VAKSDDRGALIQDQHLLISTQTLHLNILILEHLQTETPNWSPPPPKVETSSTSTKPLL